MAGKIKNISGREILDSRGWPTIEVVVTLDNGLVGIASAPSSSLLGLFETIEKRDGDHNRYFGQGMQLALQDIKEKIAPALIGLSPLKQAEIDKILIKLDGTEHKEKFGGQLIFAVSIAVARAAALVQKLPLYTYLRDTYFADSEWHLPAPMMTMFNGGAFADTNLDFQEYLLTFNRGASRFQKEKLPVTEMIRAGVETYHRLGQLLDSGGYDVDTGSQGGYAPDMDSSIQALELIQAAALASGYSDEMRLGVDIGSGSLFDESTGRYIFALSNDYLASANLIGLYNEWLSRFPIVYFEDPAAPNDLAGWRQAASELGTRALLSGNEFFATSTARLRGALNDRLANAITVVPGQAGTLTETMEFLKLAKRHDYAITISQRRGETNDDFIADLAVAAGADYLKAGAPARGERVSKWNRLMLIEQELYDHK